jgi:hypothetical protein
MSNLNNRNQNTAQAIASVNDQLEQMHQLMLNLQSEVRQLSQQHKAQETLTKEWSKTTKTIEKQLKDACSVYTSPEAIDDMIEDIKIVAETIKENFDDHAQSDRFLNQETADLEDEDINPIVSLKALAMPDLEDDVTILNPPSIEVMLESLEDETLVNLKSMLNISNKITKLSSLSIAMSKHNLTAFKLAKLITNLQGQQKLLMSLNS